MQRLIVVKVEIFFLLTFLLVKQKKSFLWRIMTSDEIGIFLSQDNFSGYLLKPKILESLKFHNFIIFRKKSKDEKCHHTGFKIKNFPFKKESKNYSVIFM